MKNGIIILVLAWFGLASVQAQTVSYPHEVFDPLGIPQVEGAKLLYADKGSAKTYPIAIYQATPQQVSDWVADMDHLGFLHRNRDNEYKKRIHRKPAFKGPSTIEYYFPVGTDGDRQSKFVKMQFRFDQDLGFQKGLKVPGATMVVELTSFTHGKMELDYKKGVLTSIGITNESGFIPQHTKKIDVKLTLSNKSLIPQWPEGTPWYAEVRAKFVEGYIPTVADARVWADKLYKACAENASSIDRMQGRDIPGSTPNLPIITGRTTHWWTYTHRGIKYECYVNAELDLFGQFWFTVMNNP